MKYLFLILCLISSSVAAFSQVAPQTEKVGPITQASQQNQELWKKQQDSLVNDSEKKLRQLNENEEDFSQPGVNYLPEPRLTKEQKQQTALGKNDLLAHAEFLKLPKTGIFKLLPNLCGDSRVVDVRNEKCSSKNFASIAHYSFRRKLYDFQDWTDLLYQDEEFRVGLKGFTVGMIAELGEIPIESLNADSPEIKTLLEFQIPKKAAQISASKKEIENGVDVGKLKFSDKTKVKLNQAYLLRSHAYRSREAAANDRRIDLIVVFKIVGIDENNGLTIIWKELYKGNSHQI